MPRTVSDDSKKSVHDQAVAAARARRTLTYTQVARRAGLPFETDEDVFVLSVLLTDLSRSEHQHGRPLLSAVVVHAEDGAPGTGFYTLARELGSFRGRDTLGFYAAELSRVHDFWAARQFPEPPA